MARSGFTLFEMASVLAVSGALLSIAVPSFGFLVASARMSSASNDLLADLYLTRSEAMKRKLRVLMANCAANLGEAKAYAVNPFVGTQASNILAGGDLAPSAVTGLITVDDRELGIVYLSQELNA